MLRQYENYIFIEKYHPYQDYKLKLKLNISQKIQGRQNHRQPNPKSLATFSHATDRIRNQAMVRDRAVSYHCLVSSSLALAVKDNALEYMAIKAEPLK